VRFQPEYARAQDVREGYVTEGAKQTGQRQAAKAG
jgi:hypothetical protein